jgi:sec-independent protein translocase protein TatA
MPAKEEYMRIFGLGLPELLLIIFIFVILFGAKKLPDLGKSMGEGIKNFKNSLSGKDKDVHDDKTQPPSKD